MWTSAIGATTRRRDTLEHVILFPFVIAMQYEPVIGLEVHVQLATESKIFCGCSALFGATPNENTCPVCLGLPGALPVLNAKVLELALRAALAVECKIPPFSVFARKNYFYPDLPKGYQISQFDQPLAIDGKIIIPLEDSPKTIRIKRIHMEEDAGKLLHEGVEEDSAFSYVDLNRSGVPLIEIVSEPDLNSPEEAGLYLTQLKAILQCCKVSEASMEKGHLRCDANISMRPEGSSELGTKVEIKNLNSFRNVGKALEHEIKRQAAVLSAGGVILQETRLFNADKGITVTMRSKEEAHDYRYFPEPDLLPLPVEASQLNRIRAGLPELPEEKRKRFLRDYSLGRAEALLFSEDLSLADFYEATARLSGDPKQSANWILRDLLGKLKESNGAVEESSISPAHIASLVELIRIGAINTNQAKEVFEEMWNGGELPEEIVKQKGMTQISNEEQVAGIIDQVLSQNQDLANRYRNGEDKLQGVLVGLVMKASAGKANPALVNRLLRDRINH